MPQLIEQIHGTAGLLVPEIILLATACVLFVLWPLVVGGEGDAAAGLGHRAAWITLIGLGIAWLVWFNESPASGEGSLFHIDHLAWMTRGLAYTAGLVLVLIMWHQVEDRYAGESYACLLTILAGTSLVAAANDLVALFMSLELVSIPTYVILYLGRRDRTGGEATLKYFLLSIFSSALVLYGMSWLYGVAGSTNFDAIQAVLSSTSRPAHAGEGMLELAFALLLAGLSFRITAVPFHFYAPDVFQGTSAANASLLSFIPKIVGFVALLRLIPLSGATISAQQWIPDRPSQALLAAIAVLTMFLGNLMALRQKNLYRLMAYSSIAHAGYMLIGLVVGDREPVGGRQALLFYLAVYGLMTVGVFALLSAVGAWQDSEGKQHSSARSLIPAPCSMLDDIRGLRRTLPSVALLLAICFFSLTGLPPTAGFFGKLNLFLAAWSDDSRIGRGLAASLAINAAISAWYYLRIVALMFLEPGPDGERRHRILWSPWLAGAACSIATIALFVAPQWLWDSVSVR